MSTIRTLLFAVFVIGTQQAQGQTSSLNVGVNYAMRLQSAKANIRMPEYSRLRTQHNSAVQRGIRLGRRAILADCRLQGVPTYEVRPARFCALAFRRPYVLRATRQLGQHAVAEERAGIRVPKAEFNTFECPKSQFAYQVGVGYRHMFSENVSMTAIVNYSTFNFLRGSDGKGFKTSTPFSMIIKFGWHF